MDIEKHTVLAILNNFIRTGKLPREIPPEILGARLGDKKLEQTVHYMAHVIEDQDIRDADPELNTIMLEKLKLLILNVVANQ